VVVGDRLDFLYPLPGPIAAGTYLIEVFGIAEGNGSVLQAELDDVSDAGAVAQIDVETYTLNVFGGVQSGLLMNVNKTLPLVDAGCGDTLRLRITMPMAGPDGGEFDSIQPQLTIP
jgi:hypothetical protein